MAKAKQYQCDVLIAGGGAAGLALACVLGKAGVDVHVVDPFPPPELKALKPSGRTVALMNTSINVIKATGCWDMIAHLTTPMEAMRIIDVSVENEEPLVSEFQATEIDLPQFGYNISNGALRSALFAIARKITGVTFHTPNTLQNIEINTQNAVSSFQDGTTVTARLVVGADGRQSKVRELSGIQTQNISYDQSAITCLIRHSLEHNNTATEFHKPGGPLALVPITGRQSAVVWVEKTEKAEALIKASKRDFENALQNASQGVLGTITLETHLESWPLQSIKALRLTAPRTALVAEAAHVMSPITAQGLNLSLRDVASLAELVVDELRVGLDPGSATLLDRYEQARKLDVNSRVTGVDTMNKLVSNDIGPIKRARRRGLQVLDIVPPFKSFAMRQGLAPQNDSRRLTRGEAL